MTTDPQVITLTQSILLELYKTIGIDKKRLLIRLVQPFAWLPARRFAALAVEFDRAVAEHGLVGACRVYLPKYIERVHFEGDENIPCEGPLLVCSNHPGVFDSFAIISRFPRDDLRLIISGVPFTRECTGSEQIPALCSRGYSRSNECLALSHPSFARRWHGDDISERQSGPRPGYPSWGE